MQFWLILALECLCQGAEGLLGDIRNKIAQILPNTQVIEQGTKALARAEARVKVGQEAKAAVERERRHRMQMRSEREFFAAVLVPLVMVTCAVWVGLLAFNNVRDRKAEIGIQRAMGFRARQIMFLFLSKYLIMGLLGGVLGIFVGLGFGRWLGLTLEGDIKEIAAVGELFNPVLFLLALIIAPVLTVVSGWLPTIFAIRQDPAEALREK